MIALTLTLLAGAHGSSPESCPPFDSATREDWTGRYAVEVETVRNGYTTAFRWVDREGGVELELARGRFAFQPSTILVSSSGEGFVVLGEHCRSGGVMRVYGADGRLAHAVPRAEWVEVASGPPWISRPRWRRVWLDEEARELVIWTREDQVSALRLDTGVWRDAGVHELRDALLRSNPAGWQAAFTFALERPGTAAEWRLGELLPEWVRDEGRPTGFRLRAARLLAEPGADMAARRLFVDATVEPLLPGITRDDRLYALKFLPEVLGAEALPHLREAMRGADSKTWSRCLHAFESLGEAAVPTLVEMLAEREATANFSGGAAHSLGDIGSPLALPALRLAADDPRDYVRRAAARAIDRIESPD